MSCNSCCISSDRMSASSTVLRAARRFVLGTLLALASAGLCFAASWRDELPRATVLGSGDLTWFGLRIYHAALWSEHKPFNPDDAFALELTYHRSIKREQFVKASMDEIRRLFPDRYDNDRLKHWEAELSRAFVDVAAGDQLIGVFVPRQGCRFYSRLGLTADLRDTELATAFFAIWLDKRTREAGLRKQLLGDIQ
jgi:hypothetical protein